MAGQNWEKAYTALGTNRKRRFIYTHRSGGCCRNLEAAGKPALWPRSAQLYKQIRHVLRTVTKRRLVGALPGALVGLEPLLL